MSVDTHDNELIELLRKGESAAFRKLYVQHFNMIRYFVINNNGREEDARDLFQEASVVLFEQLSSGKFELHSSLKTWIYAVCRNKWLKQLEKKKKNIRLTDFEKAEDVMMEEKSSNEIIHQQLRISLSRLGVGCRKLLLLFYYFKKNMEEIATDLGYTNADNAKSQKYKCLQKLKTIYSGSETQ
ncbi:MAG: sigma-70 family RNA polymerase sigma factor [Bacteroidetes bacterium]|nr:sigma-70 family RNA polymerase sigma factor [Bacteroidota bacterium]